MTDLYLKMGIALILVSGLILLLGMAAKKRQDKDSLMKVMGYQSLGPKKGLAMVKVGQEVLLVGVTATDVKLLKSMDRPLDLPASPSAAHTLAEEGPSRFDDELSRLQEPAAATKVISADAPALASSSALGRLKALKDQLVCS